MEKLIELASGYVFYIGDHEADIKCAFNANNVFRKYRLEIKVVSIGAFYSSNIDDTDWPIKPDYKSKNAMDIINIIQSFNGMMINGI
ncbi:MAG: hypothetical protein ACE5HX_09360 [bacterium]